MMELSAPLQRPLPSRSPLGHGRPFLSTASPSLFFSRSFPVCAPQKKPLVSRSISEFGRSGDRFRKAVVFEEETSSTAIPPGWDDDAAAPQKGVEGQSFAMVSPAEEDSDGGADGDTNAGQPEAGEDLLSKLNLQVDFVDAPTILIFGPGALLALWLSLSVISALDSVPVKNRDELFAKLQELKEQIF